MRCTECGKNKDTESFNAECGSPTVCFKCRVSSISIGFGGHQEFFHNDTIADYQRRTVEEGRANGLDPVPAWHNTYTGTVSGKQKKLEEAVKKQGKTDAK